MRCSLRDLDDLFGLCCDPVPCSDEERTQMPTSLTKLNADSAKLLKPVMDAADAGLELVACVFSQVNVLWVVDRDGEIWMAIEEILTGKTKRLLRPSLKGQRPADDETRIGHPALVAGSAARIGGELRYELGYGIVKRGWHITNASGRYGTIPGRTRKHLENAAVLFHHFGLQVRTYFYE